MDLQQIDQQYQQISNESQSVNNALQNLANKMKQAMDSGDQNAREWMLDLRELALAIRGQQQEILSMMQMFHQAAQSQQQNYAPAFGQPAFGQPMQQPMQQPMMQPSQGGGFFSDFLNSGFGKAIEMGAGFGIGEDLIDKIF